MKNTIYLAIFLSLLLVGCGGGSSDDPIQITSSLGETIKSNGTNPDTSNDESSNKIRGIVHANFVKNSEIKLFGIDKNGDKTELQTTTSNDKGYYEFKEITGSKHPSYIIEAINGTYFDEATNKEVQLIEPLKSITYLNDDQVAKVAITPATDIVTRTLEKNKKYAKKYREAVAKEVVKQFAGSLDKDINLFETLPVNLDSTQEVANSEANQKVYSSLLAGLSQLQQDTDKSIKDISEEFSDGIEIVESSNSENDTTETSVVMQENSLLSQYSQSLGKSIAKNKKGNIDTGVADATKLQDDNIVKKYVRGTPYKPADIIVKDNVKYKCKKWPEGGWCSLSVYAPGGSLWQVAWDKMDGGDSSIDKDYEAKKSSVKKWKDQTYSAGDKIYFDTKVYECKGFPYTGWCSNRRPGSNGWRDAWREFKGDADLDKSIEDEASDKEMKDAQKKQANIPLEKPELVIIEKNNSYTIIAKAEYKNSYNKPLGYILYKDGKKVKETKWLKNEDTISFTKVDKDDKKHEYYIKTYRLPPKAIDREYSKKSPTVRVSAKSTDDNSKNIDKSQTIIYPSRSSFVNIVPETFSESIYINGGDGDGDIKIINNDPSIVKVINTGYDNQFILKALKKGTTSISIYKKESSDGKFTKSNILTLPVKVIAKENSGGSKATFNKKPGKPIIEWLDSNLKYGEDFGFTWNMWYGTKAKTAKWYLKIGNNFTEQKTVKLDSFDTEQGEIKGTFGFKTNNVKSDTSYTFYVELCNDNNYCSKSSKKTVKFLKQGSIDSGSGDSGSGDSASGKKDDTKSSKKKIVFKSKHFAVAYLPSWKTTWFSKNSYKNSQIVNIDPLYTHLVISFAKPNLTFSKDSFTNTGIQFSPEFQVVKLAIKEVKKKGVKVLLAVGGQSYKSWSAIADEHGKEMSSTTHKKALFDLVKALDIDGIDVDYEIDGVDEENIKKYYKSVISLYEVTREANIMLSIAGWSTGADCTKETKSDEYCSGKLSFWGGNAGRERQLFNMLNKNGFNTNELFDYVSVMSYDGGFKRFDPINLYESYKSIYTGKLALGLELAAEGFGGAELVSSNTEAKQCQSSDKSSMLAGNSYEIYGTKKPYSVQRFVDFIKTQDTNGGIMLWSMFKDAGSGAKCSNALKYDTFNISARKYLGGKTLSYEENLLEDIKITYNNIVTFKDSNDFKNTKKNFDNFDLTDIDNNISLAKKKYENDKKDETLKASLEEILRNIKLSYVAEKNKYGIELLKKVAIDKNKKSFTTLSKSIVALNTSISKIKSDKLKLLNDNIVTFLARDLFKYTSDTR